MLLAVSLVFNFLFIFIFIFKRIKPAILINKFIDRFKIFWTRISKRKNSRIQGRPCILDEIKLIIKKIYLENPGTGGLRIWMTVKHLGYSVSLSSVYRELKKLRELNPTPSQKWKTFIKNSRVIAMDFTTTFIEVSKDVFTQIFIFTIFEHKNRKVLHMNVTSNPSQDWVIQQLKECFYEPGKYKYMIHDRDTIFMNKVRDILPKFFNIESSPTSPQSPWQNPYIESFHATLKRDLLNKVIFKDLTHLRMFLRDYIHYYNHYRLHSGLMDSPEGIAQNSKPECKNPLKYLQSVPVLNGLHHYYYWKSAA